MSDLQWCLTKFVLTALIYVPFLLAVSWVQSDAWGFMSVALSNTKPGLVSVQLQDGNNIWIGNKAPWWSKITRKCEYNFAAASNRRETLANWQVFFVFMTFQQFGSHPVSCTKWVISQISHKYSESKQTVCDNLHLVCMTLPLDRSVDSQLVPAITSYLPMSCARKHSMAANGCECMVTK